MTNVSRTIAKRPCLPQSRHVTPSAMNTFSRPSTTLGKLTGHSFSWKRCTPRRHFHARKVARVTASVRSVGSSRRSSTGHEHHRSSGVPYAGASVVDAPNRARRSQCLCPSPSLAADVPLAPPHHRRRDLGCNRLRTPGVASRPPTSPARPRGRSRHRRPSETRPSRNRTT